MGWFGVTERKCSINLSLTPCATSNPREMCSSMVPCSAHLCQHFIRPIHLSKHPRSNSLHHGCDPRFCPRNRVPYACRRYVLLFRRRNFPRGMLQLIYYDTKASSYQSTFWSHSNRSLHRNVCHYVHSDGMGLDLSRVHMHDGDPCHQFD